MGQLIQHLAPQSFLPDFGAFQGSNLGYGALLLSQLVILSAMAISTCRLFLGRLRPSATTGRWMVALGGVYMAGSLTRIMVGLWIENVHPWFSAWIPAFFHVVLALFVLTLGHYLRAGRTR